MRVGDEGGVEEEDEGGRDGGRTVRRLGKGWLSRP